MTIHSKAERVHQTQLRRLTSAILSAVALLSKAKALSCDMIPDDTFSPKDLLGLVMKDHGLIFN
jgi:hypothetical protein